MSGLSRESTEVDVSNLCDDAGVLQGNEIIQKLQGEIRSVKSKVGEGILFAFVHFVCLSLTHSLPPLLSPSPSLPSLLPSSPSSLSFLPLSFLSLSFPPLPPFLLSFLSLLPPSLVPSVAKAKEHGDHATGEAAGGKRRGR